jgi:CBS-domain-containing membrane protein
MVASTGQIVATLSASDFRSMSADTNFSAYLTMTVQDFLSEDRDEGTADRSKTYRAGAAVCITSKGPILSAVEYMIDYHKHRVWVVAPDDSTGLHAFGVGCISLTDVIRTITLFSKGR